MTRLPWQPATDGPGFRSYPDGKKYRYAAIWPDAGAKHGKWRWLVRLDPPNKAAGDFEAGKYRNGVADTKQEAADAATEAWWEMTGTET